MTGQILFDRTNLFRVRQKLGKVLQKVERAVLFVTRQNLGSDLLRVIDLVSFHENL